MDEYIKVYWEKGNGKQLIEWSGAEVNLANLDHYKRLSMQYDELGDAAAKEIFTGRSFPEAYLYINELSEIKINDEADLPHNLKKMLLTMQEVPSWLNQEFITAGCNLSMRSGINGLICLRDYSLMGGYEYAYLNKPLVFTGALKKGASKRITDTLDFWVHVTRKNALQLNKDGYRYIIRTRMIHSFSRLMIKEKYSDWNKELWGEPINYSDMIATSIGFSLVFLHGLQKLGLTISEKEELGVFHLWKYIGHLLGISENHLPDNKKEAVEMFYNWTATQASADTDSVMLAKALENESLASNIFKKSYQKNFLKYLHTSYVWFLNDRETCERLHTTKVNIPYLFPQSRRAGNIMSQKLIAISNKNYERAVTLGNLIQEKISQEYLKADNHTS